MVTLLLLMMTVTGCSAGKQHAAAVSAGPIEASVVLVREGTKPFALNAGVICSGSIVSGHLITAAHCLKERVDVVHLPSGDCADAAGMIDIPVGERVSLVPDTDVAVLPIVGNGVSYSTTFESDGFSAFGWADANEAGIRVCRSHRVPVDLLDKDVCDSLVPASIAGDTQAPGALCGQAQGRDVCTGDSGAPLADAQGNLVAVLSYGFGCDIGGRSVYIAVCPTLTDVVQGACDESQ